MVINIKLIHIRLAYMVYNTGDLLRCQYLLIRFPPQKLQLTPKWLNSHPSRQFLLCGLWIIIRKIGQSQISY